MRIYYSARRLLAASGYREQFSYSSVRDFLQQIVGTTKSGEQLAGYGKFVTLVLGAIGAAVIGCLVYFILNPPDLGARGGE